MQTNKREIPEQLRRRISHRTSRKQLIRELFYCYIVTFAVAFFRFHFGRLFSLFSSVEHLPVNAAVRKAVLWALVGPALWTLQKYVLPGAELSESLSDSDWEVERIVFGIALALVFFTFFSWRLMLPLWGVAAAVALYPRFSRPKDSL